MRKIGKTNIGKLRWCTILLLFAGTATVVYIWYLPGAYKHELPPLRMWQSTKLMRAHLKEQKADVALHQHQINQTATGKFKTVESTPSPKVNKEKTDGKKQPSDDQLKKGQKADQKQHAKFNVSQQQKLPKVEKISDFEVKQPQTHGNKEKSLGKGEDQHNKTASVKKTTNTAKKASESLKDSASAAHTKLEVDDCRQVKEYPRVIKPGKSWPQGMKFVIPVYLHGGGPNNFYNMYRWTVEFAIAHQLGMVTHDFKTHGTQEWGSKGRRLFNQTFDLEKLQELLPTIPIEDFLAQCGGYIKEGNVVAAVPRRQYETRICQDYRKSGSFNTCGAGFNAEVARFLWSDSEDMQLSYRVEYEHFKNSLQLNDRQERRCLAFMCIDVNYTCSERVESLLEKHFIRAPYIRRMAEEAAGKLCQGNFAVLHWRNKSAEGLETCIRNNYERRETECHMKELRVLHAATPGIVRHINKIMKAEKIPCLYIAKPVYPQSIEEYLSVTDIRVFAIHDIIAMVPSLKAYEKDNYVKSLVEQEMAEIAPLFFCSRTSNWSFYVEFTRDMRKKKTVSVREFPGLPEELLKISGGL
ncbi:uncharacterized protein [Ptychodera flava]|uniref:uncharacterized protein n=1 Tax=Ptychodera flava TaxID=63121 RepID=UPI00396A6B2A